jgi:heme/copper-type cytochrome/quinol oxidase subunit 2
MKQDTVQNDSLAVRPLPKWLVNQRDGLNTIQPVKLVMKEDKSLQISFIVTGIFILLIVSVLTVFILRKSKKAGKN